MAQLSFLSQEVREGCTYNSSERTRMAKVPLLFFFGRILTLITRAWDPVLWPSDIVGRREVVLDRPETPLVITFYKLCNFYY